MTGKFNRFLVFIGLSLALVLVSLAIHVDNPENLIIGQWEEKDWAYEKLDDKSLLDLGLGEIKKHEAETWVFNEDNTLAFTQGKDSVATAKWNIKGRGHILRIKHEDGTQELFDIKELNENEMILNFDIGMESRGIAKLVFSK